MREIAIQKTWKILIALVLIVFAFLIFSQANKKFTLDELDFPIVAKATSETGVPIYYRGEATPRHLGLYHPPLYIYALAAQIKLFGFSENTVRAFGMACTLLTACLALRILRSLTPESKNPFLDFIFLACYLLNPYTAANTTLPDIDSTILPPLITLFTLLLFKNKKSFLLGLVFCLLLWTKLTTPLALIPFSILHWKSSDVPIKKILARALLIFGGGGLAFFLSYWIYCKLLNLPFSYTFKFLIHSFTKGSTSPEFSSSITKIVSNLAQAKNLLIAISLPFVFLFLSATAFILGKKESSVGKRNSIYLLGLCIAVTFFYCGLISPFGGFFKYPFPVFQFACIGISIFILECTKKIKSEDFIKLTAIAILIFVFSSFQEPAFGDWSLLEIKQAKSVVYVTFFVTCIVLGVVIAMNRGPGATRVLSSLTVIQFVAMLGINFGATRYQAVSPFPTKYSYGQIGMEETVSYLKANLKDNEVIWSMKDIGFYSGNRYIENYDFFYLPDPENRILDAIHSGVRFFVSTKRIGEDRIDVYTDVRKALENCCRLDKNFGDFYIYVPK